MEPGSSRGPAPPGPIRVIVADPAWRRAVPRADVLARRAVHAAGATANVVLTSDLQVKRLNARDRGRNKPTNVLTYDPPAGTAGGDILLALGVVRREARQAGRRPAHHLAHLVVHGALHLRGHAHEAAGPARRMEMAEARILRRLGLPNPWKSA